MTTSTQQLCNCGRPTAGAALCDQCAKTLAYAIANVAGHHEDLGNVETKATRYGTGAATKGSIGKAQPLPVDMRFVNGAPRLPTWGGVGGPVTAPGNQLRYDAWNTLVAWCRVLMDEQPEVRGPLCPRPCLHASCSVIRVRRWPGNTVGSMCLYLDRGHRWIEGRDWAPVLLDELLDLERRLVRMVNRPPDRWYAGKCDCGVDMYATQDRGEVVCSACEARYDVGTRREFLLAEAKDYLVTATEAAGALLAWTDYDGSETNLIKRISEWRDRDRLEVADVTSLLGKDRHLYRLGDIQDLLVQHAQRKQQRQSET